ncbi:type II toxin-antitoxin system RelE/ParE family toxin [bacterium]|nr:type II toxin-antitoxin system RelE/ParE family toxin [bacterium]
MDYYKIKFKSSVEKDIRKIPNKYIPQIIKKIKLLSFNPYGKGVTKLVGTEHTFRIRVGNYRIIYQINEDEKQIIVYCIRHRKDDYK